MTTAAGGLAVPAGTATAPPVAEDRFDTLRLLAALMTFMEIPDADLATHPVHLVLRKAVICRFDGDFVHLMAEAIEDLMHQTRPATEVKLETDELQVATPCSTLLLP